MRERSKANTSNKAEVRFASSSLLSQGHWWNQRSTGLPVALGIIRFITLLADKSASN